MYDLITRIQNIRRQLPSQINWDNSSPSERHNEVFTLLYDDDATFGNDDPWRLFILCHETLIESFLFCDYSYLQHIFNLMKRYAKVWSFS